MHNSTCGCAGFPAEAKMKPVISETKTRETSPMESELNALAMEVARMEGLSARYCERLKAITSPVKTDQNCKEGSPERVVGPLAEIIRNLRYRLAADNNTRERLLESLDI